MHIDLSQDRSPLILIITAITVPVTVTLLSLRFYVRLGIQKKRFALDDYVILISFAGFVGTTITTIFEAKWGTGKHLVDVLMHDPHDLPRTLKLWWIGQILYLLTTCSVKLSVAIFFCSLNPPRVLRTIAICMAVLSITTGIGTAIYSIFQCWPVDYFWTRFNPGVTGSCLSAYKSFVILEICNSFDIVTDVVLAALPAIMLWNMNMTRSKKFGVGLLLGLGALPAIAAIIRALYFKGALENPADFTYSEFPIGVTSHLEPVIAICVVCAAHLRPLMRQILPEKFFSTTKKGSSDPNVVTIGRAGKRTPAHDIAEIELASRLDSGVPDEEMGKEKFPSSPLSSQSQKESPVVHTVSHWD